MSDSMLSSVLTLSNLTFMTTRWGENHFSWHTYEDTGSERQNNLLKATQLVSERIRIQIQLSLLGDRDTWSGAEGTRAKSLGDIYLKNCPWKGNWTFLCVILEYSTKIRGWESQEGRCWLDRREFGFLKTIWAALWRSELPIIGGIQAETLPLFIKDMVEEFILM